METTKTFSNTIFTPEVIRKGVKLLDDYSNSTETKFRLTLSLARGDIRRKHDTEDEFFSDYRAGFRVASYGKDYGKSSLYVWAYEGYTDITVEFPQNAQVESVLEVFGSHAADCKVQVPRTRPTVFIGHGHSTVWKDLKDHLHEKHGYKVDAYESGARAGHAIRDILGEMLESSSFAILIMTGEDELSDGSIVPRQNVVHEAGLFQGKLGFSRAVVLLEEGTKSFSNIDGIDQIRFSKGNIKETFGEVLATLRREFGEEK